MRNLIFGALSLFLFSVAYSQTSKIKAKKYPSLMWEITGKGMSRPSYLFGTMHVSSKMVFHLSDSFYLAIRSADVVALETDPGSWQEDFSRYDIEGAMYNYLYRDKQGNGSPDDYLSINTLKAIPYEKMMQQALYSAPSIINSFLYRSNSESSSDFEEDTYLDLYIFQVGKKWNKRVCGVENFDESMKLMKEAYADAAKDKKIRERSFDVEDQFSYARLEEAYRTGNLDLLDTIQKLNSTSSAFDEKFLYRRNEIQAASIDSIIRTKAALFVGVGAAHLPGERGVIELLRKMGYRLRPIRMTERDSRHKEDLEKIHVPVQSSPQASEDGFFSVDAPGKLYSFSKSFGLLGQQQYADMINGSYYMVSRIYTNAALWGHTTADVYRKVDSVLYENIPGKILRKESITLNGYRGFDIMNRTRRGDYQRYHIFITPFEIILFKVSGNGEYVKDSKEAERFFSSIRLREYRTDWKTYSPGFGGFEAELPHQPIINNAGNWQFMAFDASSKTAFQVIRTDVFNTSFVEEDSFDLNLMEESFGASEFIERQVSRKQGVWRGYPCLDAKYQYKDGGVARVRFVIQGPHYYTLVATAKTDNAAMTRFLNSFSIRPFVYGMATMQTDTSLYFQVEAPVALEKKRKLDMYPEELYNFNKANNEDESALDDKGTYKDKLLRSDSTGELVYISFYKPSRYYYSKDSVSETDTLRFRTADHDWVFRKRKKYTLPDDTRVLEYELGDPRSSRIVRGKTFTRHGITYNIKTEADTLTAPSAFISTVFATFTPSDTVSGVNVHEKKSTLFFEEFFSTDTLLHKKAIRNIHMIDFDSADCRNLKKAVQSLTWNEKRYLDVKRDFISKFSEIKTRESADFLKAQYYASGDTIDIQYTALSSLLDQQTSYAYRVFRDIMVHEPPVLDVSSGGYSYDDYSYASEFMDQLTDSVQLTRTIFSDLLSLINVNDYEEAMMDLLKVMVDSGMVTAADYEAYLPKFLIEAKQLMKKQTIREKNQSIEKARKDSEEEETETLATAVDKGTGNHRLNLYATLLLPFWDRNPAVPQLIRQILGSSDNRLKYNTTMLLLRHKKPVHDSVFRFFAATDDYRFELYNDLRELKMQHLFPAQYLNHMDLARSEIKNKRTYNIPDSFVFVEKLPLRYNGRNGVVCFFKYRQKKDDNSWKIASVGMLPSQAKQYSFDLAENEEDDFDFTQITDTKLDESEPMDEQLRKALKRMVYAKRKSAAEFYKDESNPYSLLLNMRD